MTARPDPLGRPLLEVEDLRVGFYAQPAVVQGVSFTLHRGECLALVGESGSGKSVTSRALVGLAGPGSLVGAQRLRLAGMDLREAGERRWRAIRGGRVGFVMQDALGSLDPLRTVGREIDEPLALHTNLRRAARAAKVVELLRAVGVPEPELRARQHPHQLSGGLRQRALIASAIACGPELLIADEPTTALDAAVQAQVLTLLESLRTLETAMILVSHDFSVVARLADRIAVMQGGTIVEQGPAQAVLQHPRHPYTRSLLEAASTVQGARRPLPRPAATPSAPVVVVKHVTRAFPGPDGTRRSAVDDASFTLHAGQTLGIVGESGSGKTTLTRIVLGLERADAGEVRIHGQRWAALPPAEQRAARRRVQVVFQDPLGSFDPRYTVERVLGEALEVAGVPAHERTDRATALLAQVRLGPQHLPRRPIELSGGQRQRVAIARALAAKPDVLVCDEPVSALDVSVQAQILELLEDLQARLGLACLFISHDLGVIRRISDHVLVMQGGRIVESGPVDTVFDAPQHPYTRALLDALPPPLPFPAPSPIHLPERALRA